MANAELQELLALALRAADVAEDVIMRHYQTDVGVDWKADNTPVTIADKGAEEAVRLFAQRETPEFGFIGEEFGAERSEAEYQWVLDPIDGTKSFIHGVPLFGTLLALVRRGEPVVGLIRMPALRSTLWASRGGGAFLDGKKIGCSAVGELSQALVLSGTLNTMEDKGYGDWFRTVRRSARLYRGWGDCYGYYLVASGRAEVMVDPVVSLWDVAPMPVIFAEAGGEFSTLAGEPRLFDAQGRPLASIHEGYTAIACNGKVKIPLPSAPTKL
jgi:histidinol-phosphatase